MSHDTWDFAFAFAFFVLWMEYDMEMSTDLQ